MSGRLDSAMLDDSRSVARSGQRNNYVSLFFCNILGMIDATLLMVCLPDLFSYELQTETVWILNGTPRMVQASLI